MRLFCSNLITYIGMKRIIVPIDFSDESVYGLKLAIMFGNKYGCTIEMVHVLRPLVEQHSPSRGDEVKKQIEQKLQDLANIYTPQLQNGAQISYIVKRGKVFQEVVNQAKAFDDAVIVCSTHGASGFEEFFIGSNAFRILTASTCPVITIRHGAMHGDLKRIVLPIDITADSRQKVPMSIEMAKTFDAEIHILGVASSQAEDIDHRIKQYVQQVADELSKHGIRHCIEHRRGGNVADLTIKYMEEVNADMVAIMSEQGMSIADFVLGSYAQQMFSKSPVPVFCVTPRELSLTGSFRTQG